MGEYSTSTVGLPISCKDFYCTCEDVFQYLFPTIFGHEASGIVESVGEGVTHGQAGDHVLPCSQGQCTCEGKCSACKDDRSNVCISRPSWLLAPNLMGDDEPHFTTKDGKILNRFLAVSTFSEYTVVYKDNVVKINSRAPLEKVCLLSCGVGTGLGAVWKKSKMKPGSTVAVFGLGTVGLAAVEGCRVAGASRIIGMPKRANKLKDEFGARYMTSSGERTPDHTNGFPSEKFGKAFGLTDFINPKDCKKPVPEVIRELNGLGVDYSFECSGNVKVLVDAIESTQKEWGKTMVIGCPLDINEAAEIKTFSLLHGRTIIGSVMGGLRIRDLPELVERSLRKDFQLDLFATQNLPFSQINDAVDLFQSGNCLRCVMHMGS